MQLGKEQDRLLQEGFVMGPSASATGPVRKLVTTG